MLLQKEAEKGALSVGEILEILSGRGKAAVLIVLSIPFCQPLQIPGASTFFGLFVSFIGLRMAFGKRFWLPKKVLLKKVSGRTLQKIAKKVLLLTGKMKAFIHPRWVWMFSPSAMKIANGLMICFLGLFLALPLPIPFSNLTAAWAIFLMALGILEDDGLLVILGYGVAFITAAVFAVLAISIKLGLS